MDTSNIFKNTMVANPGLIISNSSTAPVKYFGNPEIKFNASFASHESPSSTRLNNSQRFSLEQLKINKRRLRSFKNFKTNWNGYSGEAFDEALIEKIEDILSDLDYQPQIFPTGRGTIQIEKYIDDDNLIEIEISNKEVFAYQVKKGNEKEAKISLDEVNNLISELYV